ncbi:chaoptin-like [Aphidius gifuensis]|uniref:chaoptin-like n=1 Tax=Aphidius gifuensis TaxID=684658 RepID=UPI001CDD11CF|nr:chaoptin-like [Aphidius gifuensis]
MFEVSRTADNHRNLIDFTHNKIKTIESGAFNGSHIEVIYLYGNEYYGDDALSEDLNNDTRLYLHYQPYEIAINKKETQIQQTELVDKLSYRTSERCYFSDNHLFKICKVSTSLSSVKQLVPNMWTPSSLEIIDNEILSIDLSYNDISLIENGAFVNLKNLAHLYLHHNDKLIKDTMTWNVMESQIETRCQLHDNLKLCFKHNSISSVNVYEEKIARPLSFAVFVEVRIRGIRIICDDFITSISPNAFKDSNIKTELKTLIIYRKRKNRFVLYPGSFEGLTVLENLIIDVGVIELKVGLLDSLKSLKYLKIEPNEMLTQIKTVESGAFNESHIEAIYLYDNKYYEDDDVFSWDLNNNTRVYLHYQPYETAIHQEASSSLSSVKPLVPNMWTPSSLEIIDDEILSIESNVFSCLDKLEFLSITNSSLETISSGAFDGLSKLQSLEIISSRLTRIHRNTFEMLTNLNRLSLSNNTIKVIADESLMNNKLLSILDLSFNSLESIHEKTFNGANINNLDLSYNNISLIENGAFANMTNLDHLNVDHNNKLVKDTMTWNIMESQIETRCQLHDNLKLCFKHNSISSVNVYEGKIARPLSFAVFVEVRIRVYIIRIICDDFITSISPNAFKDSNIKSELKTLIIYRKRKNGFVLYPGSFEGLTVLENLIIDVGVIELKVGLFDSLKSLKYLKFKPNEMLTGVFLGQVLANLTNLKTLEIFNNDSIGICDSPFSDILPLSITELCYTNGQIDKLEKYSFICLPSLENITITNTELKDVQQYAFSRLDNLKYINLAFNRIQSIPSDVFGYLEKLIKLELNNNKINEIDDNAFAMNNNDNLRLVNLSYNEVSIVNRYMFPHIKCNQLDLSNNKIGIIEDAAFERSLINDIYLFDNPYIVPNRNAWMVANHTFVFPKKISYAAIRCQSKQPNNCVSCHYNCLQRQDRETIEPAVKI